MFEDIKAAPLREKRETASHSRLTIGFIYRVQRGSSPQVGKEAHFQQVKQKALVLDAVDPVQK